MGVWASVAGTLGLLANTLVIILFSCSKKVTQVSIIKRKLQVDIQLQTPFNCLLINLSVTQLVMACCGNSTLAYNAFHGGWRFSSFACQLSAFGMTFLGRACSVMCSYSYYFIPGIQSMVTLSVLAFQRYMMVIRDTQFPLHDASTAFRVLCFIWSYTLLLSVPPLTGWGSFHNSALNIRQEYQLSYINITTENIQLWP